MRRPSSKGDDLKARRDAPIRPGKALAVTRRGAGQRGAAAEAAAALGTVERPAGDPPSR